MLSLIWVESSVSRDCDSSQLGAPNRESRSCHLAEQFIDIPMVLSHPFDEVVKLLDKIANLPTGS